MDIQPIKKSEIDIRYLVMKNLIQFMKKNSLVWNPITQCYDSESDVKVTKDIVRDGRLILRFGVLKGSFDCSNVGLTTLFGSPREVGGFFDCSCNQLSSLKHASMDVGGDFGCSHNLLKTLVGSPNTVGWDFYCDHNPLDSLEGAPRKVIGDFHYSTNQYHLLPSTKPSWLYGKFIRKLSY